MYLEFWIKFGSIFLCLYFENFCKQRKMLPEFKIYYVTHSVWASVWLFLTFATIKVVGEP